MMSKHNVEIRPKQSVTLGRRSFVVESQQCHVLVDGRFVGYVSKEPGCGLTIIGQVPQEIVLAVKEEVERYWQRDVAAMNQAQPIEQEATEADE